MTRIMKSIKERVDQAEEGFTLIELMVVVLIIGILMAIAIPTFLGAKNSANAKAAESNVRNMFTDESSDFSNNQLYSGDLPALQNQEPNIPLAGGVGTAFTPNTVYIWTGTANGQAGTALVMGSLGKDNNCYFLEAVSGAAYYASEPAASSVCTVPSAWSSAWTGGTTATPPAVTTLVAAA